MAGIHDGLSSFSTSITAIIEMEPCLRTVLSDGGAASSDYVIRTLLFFFSYKADTSNMIFLV
jgi:hypothetical protein